VDLHGVGDQARLMAAILKRHESVGLTTDTICSNIVQTIPFVLSRARKPDERTGLLFCLKKIKIQVFFKNLRAVARRQNAVGQKGGNLFGPYFFVDDSHALALYFEADSVQCDYMVSEIKPG